jgi:L-arabinose isomerase
MQSQLKIGLFGTGLDTYWGQFDGLLDVLNIYQGRIRERIKKQHNTLIHTQPYMIPFEKKRTKKKSQS